LTKHKSVPQRLCERSLNAVIKGIFDNQVPGKCA